MTEDQKGVTVDGIVENVMNEQQKKTLKWRPRFFKNT